MLFFISFLYVWSHTNHHIMRVDVFFLVLSVACQVIFAQRDSGLGSDGNSKLSLGGKT